jgi:hypothetical protein
MIKDPNNVFYLQHFLTGKLVCKKNKNKDMSMLHLDDLYNEIVPVYVTPALINNEWIMEDEPLYLHFTGRLL